MCQFSSHILNFLRRTQQPQRQVDRASLGAVISAVAQAAGMGHHDRWGDFMVVNGVKKRELMIINGG